MSTGLIALLDDVVALAKLAATSLDDVAAQTAKAGVKAAGVVVDDAAVTPRYLFGFAASRELPIVRRIAMGSLRNKLFVLLPASLSLSHFASWTITPLLMLGGFYLCYEGTEKLLESVGPHHPQDPVDMVPADAKVLEDVKVASAVRTDFILSAEIMAIALASVAGQTTLTQALVLLSVGAGITLIVYAAVAIIVKADDVGLALARTDIDGKFGATIRAFGRSLVIGMPGFLQLLGAVGVAAMIWVGGGIIVHGLDVYGVNFIGDAIEVAAAVLVQTVRLDYGIVNWAGTALLLGIAGLFAGIVSVSAVRFLLALSKRIS